MRNILLGVVTALILVGGSRAGQMPDVNGVWQLLNGAEDHLLTITLLRDKITFEAPDLSCELTELQTQENGSITANSECSGEDHTAYAKETLTVLPVGQDTFLIEASVPLSLEKTVEKNKEVYTTNPPSVSVYRKVQK
jgi:hypothetical protein